MNFPSELDTSLFLVTMAKWLEKKMAKLFTCDYLPAQYNMAKFLGNVSFEETNTEPSIQKIDGI